MKKELNSRGNCNYKKNNNLNNTIMTEIQKIEKALAFIKLAQDLVCDFSGERDFLEDVSEKLDDVKVLLADTIAVNDKETVSFG